MKKIIMLIMAVALMALPAMAQQDQWQSTSVMQKSGSAYTPQVTAVGAAAAPDMGTTTATTSSAIVRPGTIHRTIEDDVDPGAVDENSPVGEPWVLAIFAAAFAGVLALRRRRAVNG